MKLNVHRTCGILVGSVLGFAGIGKVVDEISFAQAVYGYGITGGDESVLIASVLPWIELVVAACCLTGVCRASALLLSVMTFAVFLLVQIWALFNELSISCGCFANEGQIGGVSISITGGLLAVSIVGAVAGNRMHLSRKMGESR